jgi:hypothetical protein
MRFLIAAVCCTTAAFAASFTVNDPHGEPKCPAGVTVGCDVVGPTTEFDFKTGTFTFGATSATIQIYMDFGPAGATDLSPFPVIGGTSVISSADLFFYGPGGQIYAIPLFTRSQYGGATAGTVYLASSSAALLNSETVLNNPTDIYYRPGNPVWINTTLATPVSVGSVVLSSGAAQGTTWLVTVSFSYGAGSPLANVLTGPGLTFFTGTATCANDIVSGGDVPEPASWMLLSSGLGVAFLASRRRNKLQS